MAWFCRDERLRVRKQQDPSSSAAPQGHRGHQESARCRQRRPSLVLSRVRLTVALSSMGRAPPDAATPTAHPRRRGIAPPGLTPSAHDDQRRTALHRRAVACRGGNFDGDTCEAPRPSERPVEMTFIPARTSVLAHQSDGGHWRSSTTTRSIASRLIFTRTEGTPRVRITAPDR